MMSNMEFILTVFGLMMAVFIPVAIFFGAALWAINKWG